MGPRETYLLENAARSHLTVTEADRDHARHADACRICHDDERNHHHARERADRVDEARAVLAVGILEITQRMDRTDLEPLTVEQIRAALDKLGRSHSRIFRRG